MQRTPVIFGAFIAALIAGLIVRFFGPGVSGPVLKEKFMQREVGAPVNFGIPVQPADGTSPILGSDPKPVSQKPYEQADDSSLYFMASNKVGADCCPSTFSSDTGCVCLTDDQKALMSSRGGNRAAGGLA